MTIVLQLSNILCYGIFTHVATITGTKICARQNLFKTNTATDLPLQLHTRSCRKSDDICPRKKTGTRPPLSSHPNIKGDLTGDCAFCEDFQI